MRLIVSFPSEVNHFHIKYSSLKIINEKFCSLLRFSYSDKTSFVFRLQSSTSMSTSEFSGIYRLMKVEQTRRTIPF